MSETYGPLRVGDLVVTPKSEDIQIGSVTNARVAEIIDNHDEVLYVVTYVRDIGGSPSLIDQPVLGERQFTYKQLTPAFGVQQFSQTQAKAKEQAKAEKQRLIRQMRISGLGFKGGGRGSRKKRTRKKRTRKKRTRKKRSTMRGGSGVSREWILNWYKQGYPEDEVEGMTLAENVCRECKILKSKYYPGTKVTVVGGDEF